jgi:hypothetical protein
MVVIKLRENVTEKRDVRAPGFRADTSQRCDGPRGAAAGVPHEGLPFARL